MKKPTEQEKEVAEASAELTAAKTSKRGGRRAGAGRKPSYLKKAGIPPITAHLILAQYDVIKLWGSVLESKSDDVRLRALEYLTDRIFGRPTQPTELSGAMRLEHTNVAARIAELEKELGYSPPTNNLPLV